MLRLVEWIVERLDFELDLSDDRIVDPLTTTRLSNNFSTAETDSKTRML